MTADRPRPNILLAWIDGEYVATSEAYPGLSGVDVRASVAVTELLDAIDMAEDVNAEDQLRARLSLLEAENARLKERCEMFRDTLDDIACGRASDESAANALHVAADSDTLVRLASSPAGRPPNGER